MLLTDLGLDREASVVLGAVDRAVLPPMAPGFDPSWLLGARKELAERLGEHVCAEASVYGASLPRTEVVEVALSALKETAAHRVPIG